MISAIFLRGQTRFKVTLKFRSMGCEQVSFSLSSICSVLALDLMNFLIRFMIFLSLAMSLLDSRSVWLWSEKLRLNSYFESVKLS